MQDETTLKTKEFFFGLTTKQKFSDVLFIGPRVQFQSISTRPLLFISLQENKTVILEAVAISGRAVLKPRILEKAQLNVLIKINQENRVALN